MKKIRRSAIFKKLNPACYQALMSARNFCELRENPYVEIAHWLHLLLQANDSDLHRILNYFEIDLSRLNADLIKTLDRFPRHVSSMPDFSMHLEQAIERAWLLATLLFQVSHIRSGFLLAALLREPALNTQMNEISPWFQKINTEILIDAFETICGQSSESSAQAVDGNRLMEASAHPDHQGNASVLDQPVLNQSALDQYSTDLTGKARKGELDNITGRDTEIRQMIDILMRRRQNNPILTGEAGVGKTAVVEGLALKIVRKEVPPPLQTVELRTLDIALLQAGASQKGEFEARLKQVIEAVQSSPVPIILFIDEAHTLIGAGGAAGTGDAANLLKPLLARGALRTIAATTWSEYKKYIEKDPALTRRFQVVKIEEPSEEKALNMLRAMAKQMSEHHQVTILDEALKACVKLSHRYLTARQLPDKSVSLLDTACARVATSLHAVPPAIEDQRAQIASMTLEREILQREQQDCESVTAALSALEDQLATLEQRWETEKELLDSPEELKTFQGENPLIYPCVDERVVAGILSDWTGIPVGGMLKDEIKTILELDQQLARRVLGQDHALRLIAQRVQTSRAGLENPNKPLGVFLLAGPSGVGKTETALALAERLYGGEHNLITINLSEFQEAHSISTLKGAPPGYVGYGQGGVLTEAVRRKPYSVILLDEVEKAHPDVHELFFQVFDKGVMEDGEGRKIDFKNTIILLTSNVGSDLILRLCEGEQRLEVKLDVQTLTDALREPLLQVFPAAFLGRLIVIPYYPLPDDRLADIARLQLERIRARMDARHRIALTWDEGVVDLIISRCTEIESGGRLIDAILTNTVLPEISRVLLQNMTDCMTGGERLTSVRLTVDQGVFGYEFQ